MITLVMDPSEMIGETVIGAPITGVQVMSEAAYLDRAARRRRRERAARVWRMK